MSDLYRIDVTESQRRRIYLAMLQKGPQELLDHLSSLYRPFRATYALWIDDAQRQHLATGLSADVELSALFQVKPVDFAALAAKFTD